MSMQNQVMFEVCVGNSVVLVPQNKLSEFIQRNKKNIFGYWRRKGKKLPDEKN